MSKQRKTKVVETEYEIRINDLIRHYKCSKTKHKSWALGGVLMRSDFCLKTDPPMLQLHATIPGRAEIPFGPPLYLSIYRPQYGGWSAYFICGGIFGSKDWCGNKVISLYARLRESGIALACRHCHGLKYSSQQGWKIPKQQSQSGRPPRWENQVPQQVPVVSWHDHQDYTDEELERMRLFDQLKTLE